MAHRQDEDRNKSADQQCGRDGGMKPVTSQGPLRECNSEHEFQNDGAEQDGPVRPGFGAKQGPLQRSGPGRAR